MRIVGGRWRRTPLAVAGRLGLRPTPERVRETVFDWLAHLFGTLDGRSALDLFAGSGALGFEALSRGMRRADFVELDRAQAANLKAVAGRLSDDRAEAAVHLGDAFAFLDRPGGSWDVVFIDPPYALGLQDEAIARAAGRLSRDGVIYVERAGDRTSPEVLAASGLVRLRAMTAGQVACELLGFADGPLAALAKPEKPLRGKAAKIAAKQAMKAAAAASEEER